MTAAILAIEGNVERICAGRLDDFPPRLHPCVYHVRANAAALAKTSFTLVGNELGLVWEIFA